MKYLVTDATFWDNLPYFQELSCGRVRFARSQVPFNGLAFDLKGLALSKVFNSPPGTWLIREHQYSEDRWIYEALIGKAPSILRDERG